jgi:hypothetical protein
MTTQKSLPPLPLTSKPYYVADTGHFGIKVKICFSDSAFQHAVKDSGITAKHNALDIGLAESHIIQQEGTYHAMLAIVFNYEEMAKLDALERMGVIYHEVSHTTTHIFEYIGETNIGDESRSYLGEHVFKQVFAAYATEDETRECTRKRDRKTPEQVNKAILGAILQMAELNNGGTRSDSVSEPKSIPRRTKNSNRSIEPKTSARIRRFG